MNVHHPLSSSDWDADASSRQVVKSRETFFRFLYLISRVGGDLDFYFILFLGRRFRSSLSLSSRLHISTYSLTVDFNHRKCGPRSHSSQRWKKTTKPPGELFSCSMVFVSSSSFFHFFSHVERSLTRQTFGSIVYNTQCPVYIYIHSCVCVCIGSNGH